jgi:glycosyltransferase involved in cell wall biosynthesis
LNKKDNLLRFLNNEEAIELSKFNGIITINDNDFNKNKGKFDKLFFIPNAINLNEFNSKKDVIRDDKSVLFIGRVEKYKGLHYLINSIKLVRATIPSI